MNSCGGRDTARLEMKHMRVWLPTLGNHVMYANYSYEGIFLSQSLKYNVLRKDLL